MYIVHLDIYKKKLFFFESGVFFVCFVECSILIATVSLTVVTWVITVMQKYCSF